MIIVVRHGRTASNASGLLLGRADPGLDETGLAQAASLGTAIAGLGRRIDRIVHSPLTRTRQTAVAIADALADGAAPMEADARFLELDYGEWDGRPVADVSAKEWATWRSDIEFAPPGGESLATLGRRVRLGLHQLEADAAEQTIVVVTHVSPIKAAVAWALGADDELVWRLFVSPASITTIAVSAAGRSLHGFNERGHLDT